MAYTEFFEFFEVNDKLLQNFSAQQDEKGRKKALFEILKNLIHSFLYDETIEVDLSSNFKDDLAFDSLEMLEFGDVLEKNLKINFGYENFPHEGNVTVSDYADYVLDFMFGVQLVDY